MSLFLALFDFKTLYIAGPQPSSGPVAYNRSAQFAKLQSHPGTPLAPYSHLLALAASAYQYHWVFLST